MSDICPCCDSAVFSAEKAAISGKNGEVWHKQCMKCVTCKKRLDSMTFNEHKGWYQTFKYDHFNMFLFMFILTSFMLYASLYPASTST
jgi:hypothetical protein